MPVTYIQERGNSHKHQLPNKAVVEHAHGGGNTPHEHPHTSPRAATPPPNADAAVAEWIVSLTPGEYVSLADAFTAGYQARAAEEL